MITETLRLIGSPVFVRLADRREFVGTLREGFRVPGLLHVHPRGVDRLGWYKLEEFSPNDVVEIRASI